MSKLASRHKAALERLKERKSVESAAAIPGMSMADLNALAVSQQKSESLNQAQEAKNHMAKRRGSLGFGDKFNRNNNKLEADRKQKEKEDKEKLASLVPPQPQPTRRKSFLKLKSVPPQEVGHPPPERASPPPLPPPRSKPAPPTLPPPPQEPPALTQNPKEDGAVVASPVVEDPPTQNPKEDEAVVASPVVEDPPAQNPKEDEAVVASPVVEDPPAQNPKEDEAVVASPVVEDPPAQNPKEDEAVVASPVVEDPPTQNPKEDEAVVASPVVEDPPAQNPKEVAVAEQVEPTATAPVEITVQTDELSDGYTAPSAESVIAGVESEVDGVVPISSFGVSTNKDGENDDEDDEDCEEDDDDEEDEEEREWYEGWDETRQMFYYFNVTTNTSSWEKPQEPYVPYTEESDDDKDSDDEKEHNERAEEGVVNEEKSVISDSDGFAWIPPWIDERQCRTMVGEVMFNDEEFHSRATYFQNSPVPFVNRSQLIVMAKEQLLFELDEQRFKALASRRAVDGNPQKSLVINSVEDFADVFLELLFDQSKFLS